MYARATTRVSVLRGTSTDAYGDAVDAETVVQSEILASIIEQRKTVYVPADNRVQQIRYYTGRVPSNTDVQIGDRIKDEATNDIYVIDDVKQIANPVVDNDRRMDLRKAS